MYTVKGTGKHGTSLGKDKNQFCQGMEQSEEQWWKISGKRQAGSGCRLINLHVTWKAMQNHGLLCPGEYVKKAIFRCLLCGKGHFTWSRCT